MSEFFIGQIMMTGFGFAPRDWAQCNGQFLPINQNQALFSLLGTQYGGDGMTLFRLPDLRSRTPVGYASSVDPNWQPLPMQAGESGGVESVALRSSEVPSHGHAVHAASGPANSRLPGGRAFAASTNSAGAAVPIYGAASGPKVTLAQQSVGTVGAAQPHSNMQPYAAINFCIALQGIYPSRN